MLGINEAIQATCFPAAVTPGAAWNSFLAKIMYKSIELTIAKGMGIKLDYTNQEFRLMAHSSVDSSLRGMIISSCGKFPARLAECIVESANGHTLRGVAKLLGR